jgi:hypothetical protein
MTQGVIIPAADWPFASSVIDREKAGQFRTGPDTGRGPQAPAAGPTVVCLLDDLETGGMVDAERLRLDRQHNVQDVAVMGYPDVETDEEGSLVGEPPTFTLRFELEDTEVVSQPIPVNATAGQFAAALPEEVRFVLRSLTLGGDLMRWRIGLAGRDIPLIEVEQDGDLGPHARVVVSRNRFVGTGSTIPVHSVLPTGEPTPLKIGAQCVVLPFPFGWGVIGAECRKFSIDEPEDPYGY